MTFVASAYSYSVGAGKGQSAIVKRDFRLFVGFAATLFAAIHDSADVAQHKHQIDRFDYTVAYRNRLCGFVLRQRIIDYRNRRPAVVFLP